jgi:hypothetical protein
MMMPPPPFDPLGLAQAQNSMFSPQGGAAGMDPSAILAKQQQHLLQQQQQAVMTLSLFLSNSSVRSYNE